MQMIPIAKPVFGKEELNAIKEVLESGVVVQGPKVELFEKEFARYLGVKHAVAVNSGTSALHVALLSSDVRMGQEVLIPPMTFFATASSVLMCGARPVFADVDKDLYTLDPKAVESALSKKTSIIMPVHLYGQVAEMDQLVHIAKENEIMIIEDAAQAHGAEYKGKKAGALGDVACFSFYATKTMTSGEGGMIVTNDAMIAEKCRLLRDHGQSSKYEHVILGFNYRMTELAAAIGLVQLRKVDKFVEQRRRNASILTRSLQDFPNVTPPFEGPNRLHSYYQYIIRLERGFRHTREELMGELERRGIASRPSYPYPLYKQKALDGKVNKSRCKVAEDLLPRLLELPVHPSVPVDGLETIVRTIKNMDGK